MNKKGPGIIKGAINLGKAVAKHVDDGEVELEVSQIEERILVCNHCDMRDGLLCTHPECGCNIPRKARWRSEDCPLGKWPKS